VLAGELEGVPSRVREVVADDLRAAVAVGVEDEAAAHAAVHHRPELRGLHAHPALAGPDPRSCRRA
jgi:hypothetical protein